MKFGGRMKHPDLKDVDFIIELCPELTTPSENVVPIFSKLKDKKTLEWVKREMAKCNLWAWCKIKVWATWKDFRGIDVFSCCRFLNRENFLKSEHYPRMKEITYLTLCNELDRTYAK